MIAEDANEWLRPTTTAAPHVTGGATRIIDTDDCPGIIDVGECDTFRTGLTVGGTLQIQTG